MAEHSKISWTATVNPDGTETPGSTWTIVAGCKRVSPGCAHCYAVRDSHRMAGNPNAKVAEPYAGTVERQSNGQLDWTGLVRPLPDRLDKPLRWTRPRRVFVCSLADLFHFDVPTTFLDQVFGVMAASPRHTFQVLTKRPERMAYYLSDPETKYRAWAAARPLVERVTGRDMYDVVPVAKPGQGAAWCYPARWPLPNVWVGTSAEDQTRADERLPHLLATPAAVLFVSAEPLLGPLDLTHLNPIPERFRDSHDPAVRLDALRGQVEGPDELTARVDWVIVGGESGPEYRPMQTEWARSLRDQCLAAGTAFFFKQNSGPRAGNEPTLDGQTWHQYPEGVGREVQR